jgi:hypothetical protein
MVAQPMKRRWDRNIVTVGIAAIFAIAAVFNSLSAMFTDSVLILTGSGSSSRSFGTTPTWFYRTEDPISFWAAIVLPWAFAIYTNFRLWR